MTKIGTQKPRTAQQNRALHLYFEHVADELNAAGLDLQEAIPKADIPWSKELVKDLIWRTIQRKMLGKESTTMLTSQELDKVYDVVNRYLAQHSIHVPFPSMEEVFAELDKELKR